MQGLYYFFAYFDGSGGNKRGFAGLEEQDDVAAAETERAEFGAL